MRSRRHNLEIVFGKIPPELIIKSIVDKSKYCYSDKIEDNKISYNSIPKNLFLNLAGWSDTGYSVDEREEQYKLLLSDLSVNIAGNKGSKSVFNLIYKFSNEVLKTDGYMPVNRYSKLLRWQNTSHYLSQDLFTTAFLAGKDCTFGGRNNDFAWPAVISTDNIRLKKILEEGIAENHYHLSGSSQCFPLTWISIMNYPSVLNNKIEYFEENLQKTNSFGNGYNVAPWEIRLFWAVSIRVYLYGLINNVKCIERNDLINYLCINNVYESHVYMNTLVSKIELMHYLKGYKFDYDNNCIDYAIDGVMWKKDAKYNRILAGERKFLYDCFCMCYSNKFNEVEMNLFYAYLLIKNAFRGEFIQVNNDIGFRNFERYQDRKLIIPEQLIDYNDEVYRLAINSTISSQPIKQLEARIMPKKDANKIFENITHIDDVVNKCYDEKSIEFNPNKKHHIVKERENKNYFFVVHFPKGKFKLENQNYCPLPRNYVQRENNEIWARALIESLESEKYIRDAIKGIDACANEVGCRPEVFAREFRLLRQVVPKKKKVIYDHQDLATQLNVTYHAGEDFLNLTDGLRAIDEAINFVNMHRGDRIGHALALGVDSKDYYKLKNNRIIMPKQDILDDDVWLLNRAYEWNITINSELERLLLSRIEDHMRYIYSNVFDVGWTPYAYYCSWKLRGDNPYYYYHGYYNDNKKDNISPYYLHNINREFPEQSLREDKTISKMYFAYHFDYESKKRGIETEVIKVDDAYIDLVKSVQEKMQKIISEKGIMIECNPSSNYLIGPFSQYSEHPITKFNNIGLEYRTNEIEKCAQLCVSINTDDQGVFDTSLTNEYAIMAAALEKKRDEYGNLMYSPEHVYAYLDNVRKMGLQQSFGNL